MVFYRKYRPQTIEELDSKEVRDSLSAAMSNLPQEVPHAFLFTGPKGLGKTSTARIVAKVVNCTGRQLTSNNKLLRTRKKLSVEGGELSVNLEPCNTCEQCTSITNGTNLDVMEMDGASNRGIDEIRELKETIKLAPFSASKKVYIIDEVHMLTTEAFNALLKTLEEPPLHALFILCTTELHKVPTTVISRCFHVPFKRATVDELVRSFKRIATSERLHITDDALLRIAALSDGGFRDGVKILEEIAVRAREETISAELVDKFYLLRGSAMQIDKLSESFVKKDVSTGITIIQDTQKAGTDIKYIIEELLKKIHTTILSISGVNGVVKDTQFGTLELTDLIELSGILSKAYTETKIAVISELPLELALVDWSVRNGNVKHSEKVSLLDDAISLSSLRKQVGNIAKQNAVMGEKKEEKKEPVNTSGVSILHFSANGEITKEWLSEFWSSLLQRLKSEHHTTAGVLRGCTLKSFDRKNLVLQTSYKFHKERLDDLKTKAIIEKTCKELLGKAVTVSIELKPSKA